MYVNRTSTTGAIAGLLLCTGGAFAGADAGTPGPELELDQHRLARLSDGAMAQTFEREGRILSVYGRPMAQGASTHDAAEAFIAADVEDLFGVASENLRAGLLDVEYGTPTKGLMFDDDTGRYRFTLHRYTQFVGDVPVFQSELKVLVRNDAGHPVVLANSSLRDIRGFEVDQNTVRKVNAARALGVAVRELGAGAVLLQDPMPVIFAGVDTKLDVPTLGSKFVASEGNRGTEAYQEYLFIIDPLTGKVLWRDSHVLNIDVEGNVSAVATTGTSSELCEPFATQAMPYARVNIGGTVVFADENGDFIIPNAGGSDVTVESRVWGTWFRANNLAGAEALLTQIVTPPGPANFLHNETPSQFQTAEVNAYIYANICRDYTLALDPGFPINDPAFRLDVNDSGSCNAFYQGSNLLFLRQGGGCPNTAFSSIVYHEYGHHLVQRATGSQCQWGEGNSDVAALQVSDEPELAFGFFGDCDSPLRDADNDCQYVAGGGCSSCGGPCHSCGQLISGCTWDLRNNLLSTDPDEYRTIGGRLWLASLFMHSTGSEITPADTINYLIADDDDGDIGNGTPHYFAIANAFTDHNMAPPPLIFLTFDFPDGLPSLISPDGTQTVRVEVTAAVGEPEPDSGLLYFNDSANPGGHVPVAMEEIDPGLYEATFPASTCGSTVSYYFSVETTSGVEVFEPLTAPTDAFIAVSASGEALTFQDDFENDLGWTVLDEAGTGVWEREVPAENCERGAPQFDADGSGTCYLTENDPGNCFRDVSFGSTTLTSPQLDATNPQSILSYYRWYSTQLFQNRDDDFVVEISDDDGASWTTLEIVDGESDEAEGGWFFKTFLVSDFVDNTDEVRVRFIAEDIGLASIVEAGVDGVLIRSLDCGSCPEDLDMSGGVDFGDILAVLTAWGNVGGPEDLDGSGTVGFGDILAVLAAWGPC